ncbi:amidohydrolase family protein [Wukongibacter sp. M2B1]|uniref:amidohydrolase family protein n=1 Tax=Wukongibacter sp. M2B1 TaxID=3088895 RepID=UPI003D7A94A0
MKLIIKNGKYYDVLNGYYVKSDILIEDGIIKSLQENIVCDCEAIDAKDKLIFPGFIDAHSHIGMWQTRFNGNDANECTRPITPTMRAIDGVNLEDECLGESLKHGYTTAMITPGSGNAICGQAAIIKMGGKTREDMIIRDYAAMKIAFGENPRNVYGGFGKSPASRMGTFAVIDKEFSKAKLYKEKRDNDTDIELDYEYEPYIPVLNKEIPLKIHAHRIDDINSGIRLSEKYGLRYTIDHCTDGCKLTKDVTDIPILLGPLKMFKSKYELRGARDDTAKIMTERGYSVSITSDHPFCNVNYVPNLLGLLVKDGLDFSDAMRMITINPAHAIGLQNRIGSIKEGKDADLVIVDGNPLEIRTNVCFTLIGGSVCYRRY